MVLITIKINPGLIPRFNIDYGLSDLVFALSHIRRVHDSSSIASMFEGYSINWTNSGRTCLYTILKALELPPKSKIGIPVYTCTSDFDAIIHAGHIPVYVDIDLQNLTMSPNDLSNKIDALDAVVVVHTFGRPADMGEIIRISGKKPVIEDCAHSLLSTYDGKLTGTIGTAGFFSFRSGKYISVGEGGLIVTKDRKLAEKISGEVSSYSSPSFLNELSCTFVTFFRSRMYHKPLFGMISLPLGQLIEKKVDLMNKYSFSIAKIRSTELSVVLNKIFSFNLKVESNRLNSKHLAKEMDNLPIDLPNELPNTYLNYFLFPIIFDNKHLRDKASDILFKNGIDTAKMFSQVPEIAGLNYGYTSKECPNSEYIADRILIVPNYYTLGKKELDKIIRVMQNELT